VRCVAKILSGADGTRIGSDTTIPEFLSKDLEDRDRESSPVLTAVIGPSADTSGGDLKIAITNRVAERMKKPATTSTSSLVAASPDELRQQPVDVRASPSIVDAMHRRARVVSHRRS